MNYETAKCLAKEIKALSPTMDVRLEERAEWELSVRMTDARTGNQAVKFATDSSTAEGLVSAVLAQIGASAKRTRAAIRRERQI